MKRFLPPSCFGFLIFLHICHTYKIQIIKLILILHKDNLSKYKDLHTTTTMFECWYDVLFLKSCVGFLTDVTGHTSSKKFNFCLISPQNICPKVLEIIKIFFGKYETSLCVLFGQQWLLPRNSPMGAVFAQSLSYCWIMNTDHNWGKWGLQLFRGCSGSFMTSWMRCRCALGVILVGRPLLGRFTTVPSFLHLWIMALTMVNWGPKALEMAL